MTIMTKKTIKLRINYNIIIPTYKRPEYLRRILSYYNSFNQLFKIIVADSSPDDIKKINQKIVSSFLNIQIKYLDHYSPDINPYHKFADMVNYANQPYCVFSADDDFVIPKGIQESVKFLEKNEDFTSAHGQYISFSVTLNRKKEQEFRWMPIYPYQPIISIDAKERLLAHFTDYYPTLYALHRTDFLRMIYNELLNSKVDPMQFGELLPDMLTLIYGKMKRLDVLYSAREAESRVGYWPTLFEYMDAGKFDEEYAKFKNCLAHHLSIVGQLDIEAAKEAIDEGMRLYMGKLRMDESFKKHKIFFKMKEILDNLKLPIDMDERIRKLYRKVILPKQIRGEEGPCPIDDPTSIFYNDFNKIKNHVLSYSKK